MRISLTTTCGRLFAISASASVAEEKVLNAMFSRASAFSNTQRMERSSSMIQTGFMVSSIIFLQRQQNGEAGCGRGGYRNQWFLMLVHESCASVSLSPVPSGRPDTNG